MSHYISDDISQTYHQLWAGTQSLRFEYKTFDPSQWIYHQRSRFSVRGRKSGTLKNSSCLRCREALQHAARLHYADLHNETRTSLPLRRPNVLLAWTFSKVRWRAVVLWGGDEVMRPMPSTVNECILKDHRGVEVRRRARGERVSHHPPEWTRCVYVCVYVEG